MVTRSFAARSALPSASDVDGSKRRAARRCADRVRLRAGVRPRREVVRFRSGRLRARGAQRALYAHHSGERERGDHGLAVERQRQPGGAGRERHLRRSPNTRRADCTMRSAPLSRSAAPMIDAIAMSTPICPQVRPNPSATSLPRCGHERRRLFRRPSPRPRAASSTMLDGVSKVTNRPHRSARGMRECAGPNPVLTCVVTHQSRGAGLQPCKLRSQAGLKACPT